MPNRTELIDRYRKLEGEDSLRAAVIEAFVDEEAYQVRDLVDPGPASPAEFRNTGSSEPFHWFGLYPAPDQSHGLKAIQFGVANPEAARAGQMVLMDTAGTNAAKVGFDPYRTFGGLMVEQVRQEGHKVFAALEVNFLEVSEEDVILFTKMSISKALLKSADTYRESLKRQSAQRSDLPTWAKQIQAARPSNNWKVAETLALSAITCAGISEARPRYGN